MPYLIYLQSAALMAARCLLFVLYFFRGTLTQKNMAHLIFIDETKMLVNITVYNILYMKIVLLIQHNTMQYSSFN